MGLASALSTALTGLNAAETTIDVVGNNVANSNTVGFKESNAVFATQFLQTQSLGSAPTETSGGTNPRQIGLGVKVAEITPDFTQGTIESSSSPSDLAIQGDGFFIVQGSQGEQLFTRNGQFKTNADNELVTINGQRLMGFGVDETFQLQETGLVALRIPLGASAVAQATENVFLEGTLPPPLQGTVGTTPGILTSATLSDGSLEVPPDLGSSDVTAVSPPDTLGSSVAPSGAAGTIAAGTYRYKITFVDADGNEAAPSAEFGPIATSGTPGLDQSIALASLPPADGVTYVSRNLYRTDASGSGSYQFVNSLNAASTTYTDSVADGLLPGGTLNEETLTPGNYSYYVTFVNTSNGLESRPTAAIGPVPVTVAGRRVRLQNLPQPASADFDAVRVYRSLSSDGGRFYRVAELTGGQTSYIDGAADSSIEVPGNELSLDGPAVNFALNLVDVVRRDEATGTYENVFQEGTLIYTPRKGGRSLGTKEFEIGASTTVQDLIAFMEQANGIQKISSDPTFPILGNPGGGITGQGQLEFVSNLGIDNALEAGSFELVTTGGVSTPIDLGFTQTQEADTMSAVTDFVVYDSLGIPLNVRLTAVLEQSTDTSTSYRWYADSSSNAPATGAGVAVGTGVVTFDGTGNVTAVNNSTMSIERRNVASASPLSVELDFSKMSGLATPDAKIAASRQDGFPPGVLSSFLISETGRIRGVFSNGVTRDLGQLRMVRFANNSGLEQAGENLFTAGENSGLPVEGNPGEQGIGTVTAGAVELSNTDIGQNLIELILASTQYRGGTRVITAVQQLLDELMALRR